MLASSDGGDAEADSGETQRQLTRVTGGRVDGGSDDTVEGIAVLTLPRLEFTSNSLLFHCCLFYQYLLMLLKGVQIEF